MLPTHPHTAESFGESLKDGQILGRFMNVIKPGVIKKVETSKMVRGGAQIHTMSLHS